MFSLFTKSTQHDAIPDAIYGTVMARSRNPVFFSKFGVEDVVMGRFDMLSLHVYLIARRMKQEGSEVALELSQEVFDRFVSDVERALRELGIGDTSVPKKKKKMVRSFYGQIDDFDGLLEESDRKELQKRVAKRFYGNAHSSQIGSELASYMLVMDQALSELDFATFTNGEFSWPETPDIKNN